MKFTSLEQRMAQTYMGKMFWDIIKWIIGHQ